MNRKDYYAMLNLPPHASPAEIKKAYRRLAMLYHPDKTGINPEARQRFAEIKEAYETLSQPARKEAYLQERWLEKAMGKFGTAPPALTAPDVLKNVLRLNRYVAGLDVYRLNREGLAKLILEQVSDQHIHLLQEYNDPAITDQVLRLLLDCCAWLTADYLPPINRQLEKLAGKDAGRRQWIANTMARIHRRKHAAWLKLAGALLLTALLCWLMYWMAQS